MAGILLAGGKSRRLGRDKAFIRLDSLTLVEIVIRSLREVTSPILIVADNTDRFAHLAGPDIKLMADKEPNKGPMEGLLTGLEMSPDRSNLVVSCDAPFLEPNLLSFMLSSSSDTDAVIPESGGKMHPLIAAYAKSCIPAIRNSLKHGDLKIVSFFPFVKVKIITDDIINRYDPEKNSFININTEKDLNRAREILERIKESGHG